ncbi:catalase HPII [Ammoniphilus oxalaticus]|uniref:Catalase n=1 Tax=Ammoniphilus oxalaticus TaxID=66863 RepID=A0A419SEH8_9BACL|nr:catalase [Ammoniphilus oxalaticus]RKD21713.1 catalase HPII [Ammoniphilus oxalaticus]
MDHSSSRNKKGIDGNQQDAKQEQLDQYRIQNTGKPMTTNQGRTISNDEQILTAGERGPGLLEDWHYFEKMTHFVQEEEPERVVHARGYSAYGEFECYQSMKHVTKAGFLQEPGKKTPLTIRFSTVQGPRGSYDTARDLRCQGVKFYTEEGNYDLTTIAMPVLINNDPMKFPDAMHAYQAKSDDDIPTASGAHDRFWDYVANNPESIHMVTWIMSDRGIIRSYRMMESWSINTYLFVNEKGVATFVRFVWKPMLGVHSFLQDEALKIGGIDPDFHRKDLREAIDCGAYPEYELGVQLIPMEDEFKYDFDVLDPTKFWPEELVPVHSIGKMTLNRNIDNYHTESEQVAFNPANVVPGIDFSNDPVLQGRLIAYHNAQVHRIGPNFQELPINRSLCPFHNNQRRGPMRFRIDVDQVNYHKNSLANNTPYTTPPEEGGYEHYPKKVEGHVTRNRSASFTDYFTQPRIFWNSLTPVEKQHTIEAFSYQLGKVKSESVRQQNVNLLVNVDQELACIIADNIGVERPSGTHISVSTSYPSLSQANTPRYANTLKVGVLIGDGFNGKEVTSALQFLQKNGVFIEIISEKLGFVTGADGIKIKVNKTFLTSSPYLVDAIYIVGGNSQYQAKFMQDVLGFVHDAYKHYKPIGLASTGQSYIQTSPNNNLAGVVFAANNPNFPQDFTTAIAQQRFWNRK